MWASISIYKFLIIVCWLAFLLYWFVSRRGAKKIVYLEPRRQSWLFLIVIVALILFKRHVASMHVMPAPRWVEILGVILAGVGVAIAIWARRYLGENWSSRPSVQEGHELVTSGPYRFVRHPIYTGVVTLVLGGVLVAGRFWFIVFVVVLVEVFWRMRVEERLMMKQFPKEYPEYRKRTKTLIPFVW